jgi:hypothetical protein
MSSELYSERPAWTKLVWQSLSHHRASGYDHKPQDGISVTLIYIHVHVPAATAYCTMQAVMQRTESQVQSTGNGTQLMLTQMAQPSYH